LEGAKIKVKLKKAARADEVRLGYIRIKTKRGANLSIIASTIRATQVEKMVTYAGTDRVGRGFGKGQVNFSMIGLAW